MEFSKSKRLSWLFSLSKYAVNLMRWYLIYALARRVHFVSMQTPALDHVADGSFRYAEFFGGFGGSEVLGGGFVLCHTGIIGKMGKLSIASLGKPMRAAPALMGWLWLADGDQDWGRLVFSGFSRIGGLGRTSELFAPELGRMALDRR
jgi:hypothetical protein